MKFYNPLSIGNEMSNKSYSESFSHEGFIIAISGSIMSDDGNKNVKAVVLNPAKNYLSVGRREWNRAENWALSIDTTVDR